MKILDLPIEIASLIVTISLAFVGYLLTYWNNLRLSRRKERLDLITQQINELYGPMFIITQTGELLFEALREKQRAMGRIFINADMPTDPTEISEWRLWVENVFIPRNEALAQIITEKAHLIREEDVPLCLKLYIIHHAGYNVLVKKWELGDFSESTSLIEFPRDVVTYAKESYLDLKRQQLKMIAYKNQ